MFNKGIHSKRKFKPLKILFFIVVFVVIVAAASGLVMFLWNLILPDLIGAKHLTFWKAAGLLLLVKILFGGVGKFFGGQRHSRKKHWRHKWKEMDEVERAEAKMRWKAYCDRKKAKH